MAIYKQDRSFNHILDEVSMNTIPMQFIKYVRAVLRDGSVLLLGPDDLTEFATIDDVLTNSTLSPDIANMTIELNHALIEERVKTDINSFLTEVNDESDPSM